ncbi:xapx domain-containing protein [Thalassospira lucentensis]|uniref:XapX domain-containing protein n=2 Tax=Thalassospira TaxID=168934 RepID=A0A285TDZ2_9PROT|nr:MULTISPECIES: XapX domain-containing protein [Thalassospira]KZB69001.1 xapx domain-containing protein [Thalassospira lucentensis]SOC20293.1 XapX domain-containing protein [Thalassospira xiamenensis]
MKALLGILVALSIGVVCRLAALPLPAPPVIVGALLVVAMTTGYILIDRLFEHRECKTRAMCGGPTGHASGAGEKQ